MIRVLALSGLLLAGCATTPPAPTDDGVCDVTVSFGSYAMGVDHALKAQIQGVIDGEAGVAASQETPWGREGESTLCVRTFNGAAADRLFAAIADLIPATSDRAPTTVTHRDGRTDASGPPPEWN